MMNRNKQLILTMVLLAASTVIANATPACGATDYTSHTFALYNMVVYILAVMTSVLTVLYVLATIIGLYSATTIYIKMQSGEDGVMKAIYTLIGPCIFLVGASIVLPGFFGFVYGDIGGLHH